MLYEWGEEKDKVNQRKHGMSLSAGVPVFEDDFRLELYDEVNSSPHEDRYITIGHNKVSDILYVVYTMRGYTKLDWFQYGVRNPMKGVCIKTMYGD